MLSDSHIEGIDTTIAMTSQISEKYALLFHKTQNSNFEAFLLNLKGQQVAILPGNFDVGEYTFMATISNKITSNTTPYCVKIVDYTGIKIVHKEFVSLPEEYPINKPIALRRYIEWRGNIVKIEIQEPKYKNIFEIIQRKNGISVDFDHLAPNEIVLNIKGDIILSLLPHRKILKVYNNLKELRLTINLENQGNFCSDFNLEII